MPFDPTTDQPGLFTGTIEFILGIIFFPLIFCAVSNFLKNSVPGKKFCKKFDIKANGILDIGNKLTSSTFAFLACLTGLIVAKQCNGNELTDRYYILDNYLIFGFSYFFYDIVSMYMVYSTEHKEEVTLSTKEAMRFLMAKPMIILHHTFVPLVGFPLLMLYRGGSGDCLLGTSFLIEASTPFVSLRVILVHLKMKDSLVYVVNGLLMLVSFFFCRVMLFPYLYYWYACLIDMTLLSTLLSISPWVHLAVIGLWSPQLIWFHRMLKGSLKLIKDAKKRNKVVVEEKNQQEEEVLEKKEDEEGVEPEKKEENLVSEDIAMDLNEPGSEEEERLLQKKVD